MKILKYFRFSLLILLCAAMLIVTACSSEPEKPSGTLTDIQNDTGKIWEVPVENMNEKEIRILSSGWFGSESPGDIAPESANSETLNDAAYERKIKIEMMYNCKIKHIGSTLAPNEHAKMLADSVLADDKAYDIALVRGFSFASLLTGNTLLELGNLHYTDFDNPWWQKDCSDALLIAGRRYGVSGSMTTAEIDVASLICFNKAIVANNGLESPYDLVKSGDWTIDKLAEMSKKVTQDINGDGKMSGADLWGICYDRDRVWNLLNSCGIKLIEQDSDGIPQVVIDSGNNITKIQNVFNILFDESYSANWRRILVYEEGGGFGEGKVLFQFDWATGVVASRASEIDFGIIPLPKYDTKQPEYLPNVYGLGVPIICVPSTNADVENTGLFLEAFSYEGYNTVIPAFYENLLKTKSARDDESEEMIDFIFDNLHYDMGTLLNIDSFTQTVAAMCETKSYDITSVAEKNKPRLQRAIKKILDNIEAEG